MKRLIKNRPVCILLMMLAAVYLSFITVDLFFASLGLLSTFMKYSGMLLCLAIAMRLNNGAWDKRDSALLVVALFLTCVSDLFLLLLERPVPGLVAFCFVHLMYIRRYKPGFSKPAAAIVAFVLAGCLMAKILIDGFPIIVILGCLYGVLIVAVTMFAFAAPLPQVNRRLATAGMMMFLLCDIHVALFNTLTASNPYYPLASFFMWLFYLPAQVLLALSGYDYAEYA